MSKLFLFIVYIIVFCLVVLEWRKTKQQRLTCTTAPTVRSPMGPLSVSPSCHFQFDFQAVLLYFTCISDLFESIASGVLFLNTFNYVEWLGVLKERFSKPSSTTQLYRNAHANTPANTHAISSESLAFWSAFSSVVLVVIPICCCPLYVLQ